MRKTAVISTEERAALEQSLDELYQLAGIPPVEQLIGARFSFSFLDEGKEDDYPCRVDGLILGTYQSGDLIDLLISVDGDFDGNTIFGLHFDKKTRFWVIQIDEQDDREGILEVFPVAQQNVQEVTNTPTIAPEPNNQAIITPSEKGSVGSFCRIEELDDHTIFNLVGESSLGDPHFYRRLGENRLQQVSWVNGQWIDLTYAAKDIHPKQLVQIVE